jgi:hypothetical protein
MKLKTIFMMHLTPNMKISFDTHVIDFNDRIYVLLFLRGVSYYGHPFERILDRLSLRG